MRNLALAYAQELQPGISAAQLQSLADALNGAPEAQCRNISAPPARPPPARPAAPLPPGTVYVAPGGSDSADGSLAHPLRTIAAAVARARGTAARTVAARAGTYTESLVLSAGDSGLTLTNYNGERAVVSGARRISAQWAPYNVSSDKGGLCGMQEDPASQVRNGRDYATLQMNGTDISECYAACCADRRCQAVSFNTAARWCPNGWSSCCRLKSGPPGLSPNTYGPAVRTAWKAPPLPNVWVTPVPQGFGVKGLRVNGKRAVRARYPNSDPEADLNPEGWINTATKWSKPLITHRTNPPIEYVVADPEWTRRDSTGNELQYQAGIGGPCSHLDPPFGYWCSSHPNRTVDGSLTHRWPSGVHYSGLLPNAPYKNPQGAVVHACRGGANCWFTSMFEVAGQDAAAGTLSWTHGGFQGAEGADSGGVWFIENVLEELDVPGEYFFDAAAGRLYYFHNATAGTPPPADMVFESTELKVLVNVSGTMAAPVANITIRGLEFRDTAYTFMDPHGMPSGGDWGLQRQGAITVEGSEGLTIDGCVVSRTDGNAVSINGYNRNLTISNSEMSWIGDSAIAQWGYTEQGRGGGSVKLPKGVGIDGMGGEQPRGTRIIGNIIHELGMHQKQSSMFFQAQSCQTLIEGNIFYNGPRAHINFNDQFGGANRITRNLILNACRETADHGPFNSWGRQPYITDVRDGTPSITPAVTEIDHNFVIGSYHTQEAIDNDDASEYFNTHHNFFAYGGGGLKSDFSGHDNIHHNNVYGYVGRCFGVGSFLPGHADGFFNNTCVHLSDGNYGSFDCNSKALPEMHDNAVHSPTGASFSVCGKPFPDWQAAGHDQRTTISAWPSDGALIGLARAALGL